VGLAVACFAVAGLALATDWFLELTEAALEAAFFQAQAFWSWQTYWWLSLMVPCLRDLRDWFLD
jgi:hypothetical protein